LPAYVRIKEATAILNKNGTTQMVEVCQKNVASLLKKQEQAFALRLSKPCKLHL
jgi:hypothetical protein